MLNQDWDSALGCFAHCLAPLLIITQQKGDVAGRIPLSAEADSTLRPFSVESLSKPEFQRHLQVSRQLGQGGKGQGGKFGGDASDVANFATTWVK